MTDNSEIIGNETFKAEDLLRILESSGPYSEKEVENLRSMAEKFPFSDLVQAAYLKVLPQDSDTFHDQLRQTAVRVRDREALLNILGPIMAERPDVRQEEEASTMGDRAAILEQFLKRDPRIVPDQQDHDSAIDLAEQSNRDDSDLMSETLARIYLMQGKTGKARQVYERLKLKFPEKSTYFAALIEEIDKKTKDTDN